MKERKGTGGHGHVPGPNQVLRQVLAGLGDIVIRIPRSGRWASHTHGSSERQSREQQGLGLEDSHPKELGGVQAPGSHLRPFLRIHPCVIYGKKTH